MLKSYLRTAFRNLKQYRGYSFINIFGLAVGLAASLLIFLYVHHELSYDRFHENAKKIHRLLLIDQNLGVTNNKAGVVWPILAPTLEAELPEVLESARVFKRGRFPLDIGNQRFYSEEFAQADPEIFRIFDFTLEVGDAETALNEPFTAVMTRGMAKKLYGSDDPIGKTFDAFGQPVTVTGILEEVPRNSHLKLDVIQSLRTPSDTTGLGAALLSWNWISAPSYILLDDPASAEGLQEKILEIIGKNDVPETLSATHQQLVDIHLHSDDIVFDGYNANKGNASYVYSLGVIAFFIVLIAAFNFMNLVTARSANRAREVGMRKVVGAMKRQLMEQFLYESLVMSFLALIVGLILGLSVGRYIQLAHGVYLNIALLLKPGVIIGILGVTLCVGVFSGLYPAFVLSAFHPVRVLKGAFKSSGQGIFLRKVLVVLQFAISIALIIGSGIVFQQIQYIKNRDIGYDRDQVMSIQLTRDLGDRFEPLVNELSQSEAVSSWSSSGNLPGRTMGRTFVEPEGATDEESWVVSVMSMDDRFIETMGMEIVEGRNFSEEFSTDRRYAVMINEAAVKHLGWENPIGKAFDDSLRVIGVVKDFHFATMHHHIEPLLMRFRPGVNALLSIKLKGGSVGEGVSEVRRVWDELFPNRTLEFIFLDDEFNTMYRREENFGRMTRAFTFLAIFVACLGLFGLASFTTEQRTKEIGIRKTLGASVAGMTLVLSREFMKWVLVANFVAWPVAYFVMNRWLQGFVFRTELSVGLFLVSAVLALIIAVITVSYQTVRAARANPVDSLRYE